MGAEIKKKLNIILKLEGIKLHRQHKKNIRIKFPKSHFIHIKLI